MTDNSGSTSWTYSSLGRVASRTQEMSGVSKTVGYGYNSAGQLTTLTTPSGQTITYGYSNNRIASITVNSTTLLNSVLYDPFGPARQWTWGNSTLAVRSFDQDGNLDQIDSAGLRTYAQDDAFRITGITDAVDSSLSWTHGYDLLDRLTSATRTGQSQTWTYDANGNRLTQGGTSSSTFTIASSSNRLSSVSGALSRTYGYDAAGHTTSYGGFTFTYNDAGRMTGVSGSATASYSLNALGQRVKKTVSGISTYFAFDEAGHLIGEYDGSGTLIQETVWMEGTPVATLRPNGGSVSIFYVHADHLNTPRRISRPSDNAILWRWDSDPFGTDAVNEDPDADTNLFKYNLRFPGQYSDAETGLNYNYFRDYDPAVGRYVESDPIGLRGGINTYAYAYDAPTLYTDPRGESAFAGVLGGLGTDVATPEPTDAAWLKWAGWGIAMGGALIYDLCKEKECPPCKTVSGKIVPVGTIAYRPLDTPPPGKVEHGIAGPHYNLYKANQNPNNCQCFWQPILVVPEGGLPADAIPIEPFAN